MWPFRKRPQPAEAESIAIKADRERLDDCEDQIAHLNRRFARLQQQVTRWSREYDEEEDIEEEEDGLLDYIEQRRKRAQD